MKNLFLGISLMIVSTNLMAQTPPLEQQIAVTQDTVKKLVNDLFQRSASSGLSLQDYRAWEMGYKQEMEINFVQFETELKKRVFGPLSEIVGRYYSVYEDANLSDNQKNDLLNSIFTQMMSMKPLLEKEYASLLEDLYSSHNIFPKALRVTETKYYNKRGKLVSKPTKDGDTVKTINPDFYRNSDSDISSDIKFHSEGAIGFKYFYSPINGCFLAYDMRANHSSEWLFVETAQVWCFESYQKIYERYKNLSPFEWALRARDFNFTHQRIIKGCKTRACIMLKASDVAYVYQIVNLMLDKEIVISLPVPNKEARTFVVNRLGKNISPFLDILKRDDLPKEVENLPFDI